MNKGSVQSILVYHSIHHFCQQKLTDISIDSNCIRPPFGPDELGGTRNDLSMGSTQLYDPKAFILLKIGLTLPRCWMFPNCRITLDRTTLSVGPQSNRFETCSSSPLAAQPSAADSRNPKGTAHMLDITQFDLNQIDAAFIEDPYPTLNALRQSTPVHHNADGSVYLTRHDDCLATYRSRDMLSDKTEAFGAKFGECPLKVHHTTSLIFNDPPYHTTVRKLISSAFTPRKLVEMERLIERIVDRLLDRVEDLGELDLIADFGMMLPTEIISFMLGVPEAYRAELRGYSIVILGALDPVVPQDRLDAGNKAVEEFGAILSELIDHRRANPDDAGEGEVLESLIFGEHNGQRLTQEELVQNCIFLLNAGHETTTSFVGNSIALLLDNPDEHRRLLGDPSLIGTTVEECLRMESPLQIGNRLAGEDIVMPSGETVPKGTYIHTSIAGANRDPEVFTDPNRFNVARNPNPHIAFITGIHVCLGASLARMEGKLALGRFVERFPKLQADGPRERLGLARFRGFTSLPIRVR